MSSSSEAPALGENKLLTIPLTVGDGAGSGDGLASRFCSNQWKKCIDNELSDLLIRKKMNLLLLLFIYHFFMSGSCWR